MNPLFNNRIGYVDNFHHFKQEQKNLYDALMTNIIKHVAIRKILYNRAVLKFKLNNEKKFKITERYFPEIINIKKHLPIVIQLTFPGYCVNGKEYAITLKKYSSHGFRKSFDKCPLKYEIVRRNEIFQSSY